MLIPCASIEQFGWFELRDSLWPGHTRAEHVAEMSKFLASPEKFAQFVRYESSGAALGFVEAALRNDYVNGTSSSPVAFLEGIYVVPRARKQGIARALVAAVEQWAVASGCREFASDAKLENESSHAMHLSLGFQESQRVVFFKKALS